MKVSIHISSIVSYARRYFTFVYKYLRTKVIFIRLAASTYTYIYMIQIFFLFIKHNGLFVSYIGDIFLKKIENDGLGSHRCHMIQGKKILTRKSCFTFSMSPIPRISDQKAPIFSVLSASVRFLPANFRFTEWNTIDLTIYPYPLFIWCGKPTTWSEPPTVSLPSFGPVEFLLLLTYCNFFTI